ncbi:MAG: 23S rRNA (adenine(2503)-C(2))-methyltransferase RlmN [Acidobacteria bacterium]|nr:23S rRNA (adenine(2503)-C(2))-methyltransferase RlmN [Acidobacteriota bacterium]
MDLAAMREFFKEIKEQPFRATQLYRSIYRHRQTKLEEITEFSKDLRTKLSSLSVVMKQEIDRKFNSQDGTRRYLFKLVDGREIESVWIPEPDRATICISSQVGCPLACEFCLTAQLKLKRNLSVGEIVGQITTVLSDVYGVKQTPDRQINIVMMGMGEPLLNYDNVLAAIRLMNDEEGMAISIRHITLSTAGIVPKIYDLGKEEIRPRLAISLTGATDELRNRLMPINKRYPLKELLKACQEFPLKPRERITFEYVMLKDVTDSDLDAKRLVKLLQGLKAKVNLIPHNPAEELPFESSSTDRVLAFQKILIDSGLSAFIRRPRGQDIFAACGQLAAKSSTGM